MDIITLNPFHAPAIALLHGGCFSHGWDEDAMSSLMGLPGTFGYAAIEEGEPMGFILGRAAADEFEVLTLCVLAQARRRGLASGLLSAALNEARRRGAVRAWLEVAEDNPAAIAFYKKQGFALSGRRPGYYAGNETRERTDALVYSRGLDGG